MLLLLCSIDQLCEVMRHAIESGEKILYELCLQNTEFVINEVSLRTLRSISFTISETLFVASHVVDCTGQCVTTRLTKMVFKVC